MVKENQPLVSVTMAAINAEKYLVEAIESILNQTYTNIEFIIVEDGSNDSTPDIIRSYAKKDKRIKAIFHECNKGLIYSLNEMLQIAKGKYVARMDADDVSFINRFSEQVDFLETHPEISLVGTFAQLIDDEGVYLRDIILETGVENVIKKLNEKVTPIHPSIMFRNTGEVEYREKALACEDLDMYFQLLLKGRKIDNIPKVLFKYRINANSISVSKYLRQKLFGDKMYEIYLKIRDFGVDTYDSFNVEELISQESSIKYYKEVDRYNAMLELSVNHFAKYRIKAREYFLKYGYINKLLVYYVFSFLPVNTLNFLRKFF